MWCRWHGSVGLGETQQEQRAENHRKVPASSFSETADGRARSPAWPRDLRIDQENAHTSAIKTLFGTSTRGLATQSSQPIVGGGGASRTWHVASSRAKNDSEGGPMWGPPRFNLEPFYRLSRHDERSKMIRVLLTAAQPHDGTRPPLDHGRTSSLDKDRR